MNGNQSGEIKAFLREGEVTENTHRGILKWDFTAICE